VNIVPYTGRQIADGVSYFVVPLDDKADPFTIQGVIEAKRVSTAVTGGRRSEK
jgi:hypothetical protein